MANRCNSCGKLCSLDAEVDPEITDDFTFSGGTITGSVRRVVNSECCGEEVKETNFDVEIESGLDHEDECEAGDEEVEVEADVTPTDTYEGKGRGQKHFYGIEVEWTAKCKECGAEATGSFKDRCPAGAMDDV